MPKRALLLVLALFLAGLSGIGSAQAATKVLTGPDTARYQHPNGAAINWAAVRRAGQSWGFVKGTQGTDYVDPNFATDWRDVAAAGLYRGTYHYAQPSSAAGSAKAQADWFAKSIGVQTAPGTLPPILDLESSGNLSVASLKTWVQTFLTELQARTHRVPMVYSYPSFWKDNMGGTTAFARYPLWIAHYGVAKPTTYGWSTYTFWQYTSTGTVNGISTPGNTDLSRFNGTSLDLAALALAGTWKLPSKTANDTTGTTTSSPPSRYVSVAPQRLLDTRKSGGPVLGITDVALPASAVPADATAAVLDVTAVDAHGPGWIRAGAAGTALTATSLNYAGKVSSTGLVLAQPNSNGHIAIQTNASATDLVVDLVGYQSPDAGTGGHWVPLTPYRVVDSRTGHGLPKHTVSGAVTVTLPTSVPATASGVVLDLTAAAPTGTGFVRVNAAGDSGSTTTLTYARGISATGLAITRASGGKITVTVAGVATDLVVDLIGYYDGTSTSGSSYAAVPPIRVMDSRSGLGVTGPGTGALSLTVPASVPDDATAVVLEVSAVTPLTGGFLRLAAPGTEATTTALNTVRGRSQTNLVITGLRNRQITVGAYGATLHLVIDLIGYQTAASS